MDAADEEEHDDGLVTCWCGARGTVEELFASSCLDRTCGGSGVLYCDCGGDSCFCHFHGSTECDGCRDCEHDEEDDGFRDGFYAEE